MTNAAATIRKSIRMMGQEATLFDRISGAVDTFGDPTFTFSQVTMTVLLSTKTVTDEDKFFEMGRQHQEVRSCYISADTTVEVGDEVYVDALAKRYAIKGINAVLYRGDVAFYRLYLQEQQFGNVTT